MKVLIVKNITREGPGLFEILLKQYNIPFDIVDLHVGETFPDPTNYSAVFVCGGPDSANDTTPKMLQEVEQVKKVIEQNIPYMGACLGMQVLVKAGGGQSIKSPTKEVGWKDPEGNFFQIELTPEGSSNILFSGLTSPLKIFHLHGETVSLSSAFTILARGKFCPIQAVKAAGNQYGFQGHFELTSEMFETWIAEDSDLVVLSKEQLREGYSQVKEEYENIGKTVLTNFLKISRLIG